MFYGKMYQIVQDFPEVLVAISGVDLLEYCSDESSKLEDKLLLDGWILFFKNLQFSLISINHPVNEISLRFELTICTEVKGCKQLYFDSFNLSHF